MVLTDARVRRSVAGKRPVLLACLPLLLALSTVFVFGHDLRSHLVRSVGHSDFTYHKMAISANLSPDHNFLMFYRQTLNADGAVSYEPHNRFPIGGYVLIALAILPFGDDLATQLYAARTLMLLCFVATALLAYLCLCRLTHHPWIATTATLLAFSSFYCLFYSDMVFNETGIDLLGVMLTFHGMVIFISEGRFRQLLVKMCIALFLGWHVYALLLPFIALGVVRECLHMRSVPFRLKCSRLLRSRYVLLGIVALLVGLSLLTFNFVNEYVALKGEKALTELPSFQSMIYRTGIGPNIYNKYPLSWDFFLIEQFFRIDLVCMPYFILSCLDALPPEFYVPLSVGAGIGVSIACLVGVYFTRPRILWATLVLFGFCWALPMRHTVKLISHDFESVFYIGLPLVFFSLILLCLSRRFKAPPLMVGFAGVALIVFVLSSFQMSHFYAPDATRRQKAELADATAIRRLTTENDLIFNFFFLSNSYIETNRIGYYLNRRIIHSHALTAEGFTVMFDRLETDALLTPKNERIFLYDSKKLLEEYRQVYQRVVSGELVARSTFDVYRDERALHYVKSPCSDADMQTEFFLHIFPTDTQELPPHRWRWGYDNLAIRLYPFSTIRSQRWRWGYDNDDFSFDTRGLRFDDKCLASIALPHYDIARIETGPLSPGQSKERADDPGMLKAHRQAYQRVVSGEVVARSTFDVYRDERVLHYVKTPCSDADVKTRFFLHIFPTRKEPSSLHYRWRYKNIDFDFSSYGLRFDDKCLASIALPHYDIARIQTGQFYNDGVRVWEAEIFLNAQSK